MDLVLLSCSMIMARWKRVSVLLIGVDNNDIRTKKVWSTLWV